MKPNVFRKAASWACAAAMLALAAIILVGGTARADNPKWTGCGVGATVGMSTTKTEAGLDVAPLGSILTIDGLGTSGTTFGLGVNCDMQMDRFVVGAFADWQRHDQAFTISSPLLGGNIASLEFDNQWSIGGRAGVLVHPMTLVYGLLAYTEVQTSDITSPFLTVAMPDLKGWSVGGGIEVALSGGFFLGAEYRFTELDTATVALVPGGGINLNLDPEMHSVQARLSYKFGFESPIK